jgi:2-polyprenyl-3-methyl-5-hydroxy-6-metoxy-1,4-benzoquinol methylase
MNRLMNLFQDFADKMISARLRKEKLALFLKTIKPTSQTLLLDVGCCGEELRVTDNFLEKAYPFPEKLCAIAQTDLSQAQGKYKKVRFITCDGLNLPFKDDSFDASFSNAVIEHVGTFAKQRRFVHELARVSRKIFLATPNRYFPIEVHTLLPFVHFLPSKFRLKLYKTFAREREYQISLLSARALLALFPKETHVKLFRQRFCFLTINLILIAEKKGAQKTGRLNLAFPPR